MSNITHLKLIERKLAEAQAKAAATGGDKMNEAKPITNITVMGDAVIYGSEKDEATAGANDGRPKDDAYDGTNQDDSSKKMAAAEVHEYRLSRLEEQVNHIGERIQHCCDKFDDVTEINNRNNKNNKDKKNKEQNNDDSSDDSSDSSSASSSSSSDNDSDTVNHNHNNIVNITCKNNGNDDVDSNGVVAMGTRSSTTTTKRARLD
jgi:hypothetical protein